MIKDEIGCIFEIETCAVVGSVKHQHVKVSFFVSLEEIINASDGTHEAGGFVVLPFQSTFDRMKALIMRAENDKLPACVLLQNANESFVFVG